MPPSKIGKTRNVGTCVSARSLSSQRRQRRPCRRKGRARWRRGRSSAVPAARSTSGDTTKAHENRRKRHLDEYVKRTKPKGIAVEAVVRTLIRLATSPFKGILSDTPDEKRDRVLPERRAEALDILRKLLASKPPDEVMGLLSRAGFAKSPEGGLGLMAIAPLLALLADEESAAVSIAAAHVLNVLPALELRNVPKMHVVRMLRDHRVPIVTVRTGVFGKMCGVEGVDAGERQALLNVIYATENAGPEISATAAYVTAKSAWAVTRPPNEGCLW